MKSFWKNPVWQLAIGILFLAFAIFLLVYLIIQREQERFHVFRDIVRLILFFGFGISSLMKWLRLRKANTSLPNEKDL